MGLGLALGLGLGLGLGFRVRVRVTAEQLVEKAGPRRALLRARVRVALVLHLVRGRGWGRF